MNKDLARRNSFSGTDVRLQENARSSQGESGQMHNNNGSRILYEEGVWKPKVRSQPLKN